MALFCDKCNNAIKERHFLTCSSCKESYHLDCCSISYKFYLLIKDKTTWRCVPCIDKNARTHIENPETSTDNITRRNYRPMVAVRNSFHELSSLMMDEEVDSSSYFQSPCMDPCNRSCPERTIVYAKCEELDKRVLELESKLLAAENEIENLLSENTKLKDEIKRQDNKIIQLKTLSKTTPSRHMSTRSREISNKQKMNQSIINTVDSTQTNTRLTPRSIHTPRPKKQNCRKKYLNSTPNTSHVDGVILEENCSSPILSGIEPGKTSVYIFGDERVRGLSTRVIHKLGESSDSIKVSASIKPHAQSEKILKELDGMKNRITKNDVIVLSVGRSDRDPYALLTNLCNTLHNFAENKILLLNVSNYRYLNTHVLKNEMRKFSNQYENCKLLDIYNSNQVSAYSPNTLNYMASEIMTELVPSCKNTAKCFR